MLTADTRARFHARDAVAEDAAGLVSLFRSCYGDTYSEPSFYDQAALAEKISEGVLRPVVVERSGEILGHMALTVHDLKACVCEAGNTVVHPDARGYGLMRHLSVALHERTLRDGFLGYVHYPTTAHDIMQRASVSHGGVETGVLLDYVPADTEYAAIERTDGRLAVTVVVQLLDRAPAHRVGPLPMRYADVLVDRYAALGLQREFEECPPALLEDDATAIDYRFSERRNSQHLILHGLGDEFERTLDATLARHNPAAAYVDVPIGTAWQNEAVQSLCDRGFVYAALLPEFGATDMLRLQRISSPAGWHPALHNSDAQRLAAFIREDSGERS